MPLKLTAVIADRKTGPIALRFCRQCLRVQDARIVDDSSVVAPNLDFTFTDDLAVIAVVNQMCSAYELGMAMVKHQRRWTVTIYREGDQDTAQRPFATSSVLRRAMLQAALNAHTRYVLPLLGDA